MKTLGERVLNLTWLGNEKEMRLTAVLLRRKIAPLTLKYMNIPEQYLLDRTELVKYAAPKLLSHRQVKVSRIFKYYDIYRPGTVEFYTINKFVKGKDLDTYVEPIKNWSYFVGDRVEILCGKDKGKQGFISYIVQERNWVIVKGLNMIRIRTKSQLATYVFREAPLVIDRQVSLVDPTDLRPTKINWEYNEKGERVRVSTRTGRILSIPILDEQTLDYKTKNSYVERSKDTVEDDLAKVTFIPKLKTFEMDIMDEEEEMNIFSDRYQRPGTRNNFGIR